MRGRMTKNSKVLIHSGTGAVGLAAIRIALYRGAEVRHAFSQGRCMHIIYRQAPGTQVQVTAVVNSSFVLPVVTDENFVAAGLHNMRVQEKA